MVQNKVYLRSPKGVTTRIYNGQKYGAKLRGQHLPTYTLAELREWCFKQEKFWELFKGWVRSNYDKQAKPTADRVNNKKSYTLDNLQIMTLRENEAKGGKIEANHWKKMIPVNQYTADWKFVRRWKGLGVASRGMGCSVQNLYSSIRFGWKTRGYHWKKA